MVQTVVGWEESHPIFCHLLMERVTILINDYIRFVKILVLVQTNLNIKIFYFILSNISESILDDYPSQYTIKTIS